jgi:hypothetical protein
MHFTDFIGFTYWPMVQVWPAKCLISVQGENALRRVFRKVTAGIAVVTEGRRSHMIRRILRIFSLSAVLALGFAGMAQADGIAMDKFEFTSGGNTFVWQLPASPVPDGDVVAGNGFIINNVPISMNNGAAILTDVGFYAQFFSGGFDFMLGDTFVGTGGPQLYTGQEATPTFLIGTFQMTDFGSAEDFLPDLTVGVPGTLAISSVQVPEPSTCLLMIVGALGLLLVTRRRG